MTIKEYTLINSQKLDRALNGTLNGANIPVGGIGEGAYFDSEDKVWKRDGEALSEKQIEELETALLAEYDKLAGAILRGSDRVKTGSFYNFQDKRARAVPKIVFVYRDIRGKNVEVPDGVELPGAVKAKKLMDEEENSDETDDSSEPADTPKKKSVKAKK